MEDAKIIDLYFARNEDAICHTDAIYGRKLFSLADRILHDAQDSEESVSDTYMKTWETIPPKRPAYFYAYLAKICRHFALAKLDWKAAALQRDCRARAHQHQHGAGPHALRPAQHAPSGRGARPAALRVLKRKDRTPLTKRHEDESV